MAKMVCEWQQALAPLSGSEASDHEKELDRTLQPEATPHCSWINWRGREKMNELGWVIVGAGVLCFANAAQAADYSWRASIDLVHGTHRNCGDAPYSNYKIEITGNKLVGIPEQGESQFVRKITLGKLEELKPDGSGRIARVTDRGVKVYFDFDAGVGPRNFRFSADNMECSFLFKPL